MKKQMYAKFDKNSQIHFLGAKIRFDCQSNMNILKIFSIIVISNLLISC